MTNVTPGYDDLLARLEDAEELLRSLVAQQADAVVSEHGVQLVRLHETDQALQLARTHLEAMLSERTRELKAANEQLLREVADRKHAQQRLFSIIESAMDAIITVNEQMMVVIFNSAAESIFGYAASEAIGSPLERFIPERNCESLRTSLHNFAKVGETGHALNPHAIDPRPIDPIDALHGLRSNGTSFPIEATISHVETAGEHLYTIIVRDISRRKQTEAALVRSEKLASVGRVAAMIAHEINNPLEAITNLLFILKSDVGSERGRQYLDLAETEVRRAAQIAQNTLGLSRQSSHAERFRVADLVDGVALLLAHKLAEKGISLRKQCIPENLEISAVESEVKQVLWNLLTNAIDAVPAKTGLITVRVSNARTPNARAGAGVRITVADNGIGMDRETVHRVLEPFYTTKSNGTGLGMWVSHEIVKKHCGALQVRSSKTPACHGTTFSVLLPEEQIAS